MWAFVTGKPPSKRKRQGEQKRAKIITTATNTRRLWMAKIAGSVVLLNLLALLKSH